MSDHDSSGFGKFVPGFEFMQNLARQATGGLVQEVQKSVPQLPNLSSWVAPTFNVEDLEKRIEELKAVHFWLEQNSRALGATIQALEVQKMTLATLQGMNFSMGDVANALKIKAVDSMTGMVGMAGLAPKGPAPAPASPPAQPFPGLEVPPRRTPAPSASPPAAEPEAAAPASAKEPPPAGVIDPMQWWGALTQQFQAIAANALKDNPAQTAVAMGKQVASTLTNEAVKTATEMTAGLARSMATPAAATAARKPSKSSASTSVTRKAASSTAKGVQKVTAQAATQVVKAAGKAAVKAAVSSKPVKKTPAKSSAGSQAAPSRQVAKAPAAKLPAKSAARSTAGRGR